MSGRECQHGYGMLAAMRRRIPSTRSATGSTIRVVAFALSGTLVLAGCVSGQDDKKSPAPHSSDSSNGSKPTTGASQHIIQSNWLPLGESARIDVLALDRVSNNVAVLRMRITDFSSKPVYNEGAFSPIQGDNETYGGTALVDSAGLKAYYPWQKKGDLPFLTSDFSSPVNNGDPLDISILYPAPPANVSKVDIIAPGILPFHDVPVQQGGSLGPSDPAFDKNDVDAPDVRNLKATQESLDGNQAEDDSGNKVDIRVSTDVLFKLNKADLTSKANVILKSVAQRLDQAKATTISIDGYTDSSGNDAINNPLSKRRAQSVQKALEKLVTRQGITFKAAGHGSSDPVASNGTADGRKKNRRVTISFTK